MNRWLRFQVSTPSGDESFNHLDGHQGARLRAAIERRGHRYRLTLHRVGHGSVTVHDSLRENVTLP